MEPQGPLEKTSWRPFTATNNFVLEESVQQIHIRYCFTPFKKGLFWSKKKNTVATQGIVAASVVEVVVEAVLEVNGVDLLELSSLMSKFNSSGRYLGLQLGTRLKQPSTNTFNKWNCKILSDLSVYFLMELVTLQKWKTIRDLNLSSLIEGSLNRNFRQYGELKSR